MNKTFSAIFSRFTDSGAIIIHILNAKEVIKRICTVWLGLKHWYLLYFTHLSSSYRPDIFYQTRIECQESVICWHIVSCYLTSVSFCIITWVKCVTNVTILGGAAATASTMIPHDSGPGGALRNWFLLSKCIYRTWVIAWRTLCWRWTRISKWLIVIVLKAYNQWRREISWFMSLTFSKLIILDF